MNLVFLLPDDLDALTGGYAYARRTNAELREMGVDVQVRTLPGAYPNPSSAARAQAGQVLASLRDGQTTLIDGLALGVLPDEIGAHADRLDLIALVHHPLYLESGLDANRQRALFESERAAFGHCNRVITTSAATAQHLVTHFGLSKNRLYVAEPGTDRLESRFEPGILPVDSVDSVLNSDGDVALLCVASLVPRKGHLVLLTALAGLSLLDWRLSCIGALDRDPAHVAAVREQIVALGLSERVSLLGTLDDEPLQRAWRRSDVFVLASEHEGYGMAFAEALGAGLPIIGTTAVAVPAINSAAARLVAPGDVDELRLALKAVIEDSDLRREMARAAWIAAQNLPSWRGTADAMRVALAERRAVGAIAVSNSVKVRVSLAASKASFSERWLAKRERFDVAAGGGGGGARPPPPPDDTRSCAIDSSGDRSGLRHRFEPALFGQQIRPDVAGTPGLAPD